MTKTEIFEKLLNSFTAYYNIQREDVAEPFAAVAEFHSHDEQYFLIRSARISEAESNEYIYFAQLDRLDAKKLQELDQLAWDKGLSNIQPHKDHRNSDVGLIIVADEVDSEVLKQVSKTKHYKSYSFGLQGWTNYRLVAIEASSGNAAFNRQGQIWKKLVRNILNQS